MEDYKKRLISEYNELLKRTRKLGIMLDKYENNKLDFELQCSFELLKAQHHAMLSYLYILYQRATIENIKLK